MEALARLTSRASVRRFKPEPIPAEHLELILKAAQQAPTDASAQLYSIIRVVDRSLREKLAELSGGQRHVLEAAEFFVLVADLYRTERLLAHRGRRLGQIPRSGLHFALVDAAIAGAHLAIAAELLGYGICWIGGVLNHPEEVRRLLRLPRHTLPASGLVVGVPAERPAPRPRLPRDLVVHTDRYRDYGEEELEAAYRAMNPIARGDWLRLLARYFAAGGVMEEREPDYGLDKAKANFGDDLRDKEAEVLESGSLGEAIAKLLGEWRGVMFSREGENIVAWLERETEAERGEGRTPGEALSRAQAGGGFTPPSR